MLFSANFDLISKDFKSIVDKISFLLQYKRFNYFCIFKIDKSKTFNYLQINFLKFITKVNIFYTLTQV